MCIAMSVGELVSAYPVFLSDRPRLIFIDFRRTLLHCQSTRFHQIRN